MSFLTEPMRGPQRFVAAVIIGGLAGAFIAGQKNPAPLHLKNEYAPEPYALPKIPNGTALKMAMVHDVIHERYLRHGTAWYKARLALAERVLEQGAPKGVEPSSAYLDACDDAAVALERTGRSGEAIALMRQKLALFADRPTPVFTPANTQPAATTQTGQDLLSAESAVDLDDYVRITDMKPLTAMEHGFYSAHANLGTFLIHDGFKRAAAGDKDAVAAMREGLDHIHTAIAINPVAHFGRETWQAIAVEHLLAAMEKPEILTSYDLIGDRLDDGTDPGQPSLRDTLFNYRPHSVADLSLQNPISVRMDITRVGADAGWVGLVQSDYPCPMPFDEPTLAIIGMWTLGGGPNPHFALALGRMMEQVGQPLIAWNAYERATEMQDRFWPDVAITKKLVAYCRERQRAIAEKAAPADGEHWEAQMRKTHVAELTFGEDYQKAYQDYEAAEIGKGVPLDDAHFYDAFFAAQPPIASRPGHADELMIVHKEPKYMVDYLPCAALGAGILGVLTVIFPGRLKKKAPVVHV